jgi:hypothetical protein
LWSRRILLIERASFEVWVIALKGNSPLSTPPGSEAQRPAVLAAPTAFQPPHTRAVDTPPAAMAEPGLPEPPALAGSAVTSEAIIAAFRLHEDEATNRQWWKTRMRDAPRYKLAICRVSVGGPNRGGQRQSSQWRPDLMAAWLVDKRHLSKTQAARMLRQHFPDWAHAADLLE